MSEHEAAPSPCHVPFVIDEGGHAPAYSSAAAAGADLRASEAVKIPAGGRAAVPTGLRLQIPPGHVGLVWPRSGLAVRHGVTVVNSPGTIDSDYRGEVQVALINLGPEPFVVERGERIAQLVVAPVERVAFELRELLPESDRGSGGFGSSGRR